MTALSAEPRVAPLETSRPAASATMSAGICVTSPSPTESLVNTSMARSGGSPWRTTPIRMPPKMLTAVMMSPAMASPRTNLEAPSMAP